MSGDCVLFDLVVDPSLEGVEHPGDSSGMSTRDVIRGLKGGSAKDLGRGSFLEGHRVLLHWAFRNNHIRTKPSPVFLFQLLLPAVITVLVTVYIWLTYLISIYVGLAFIDTPANTRRDAPAGTLQGVGTAPEGVK